jgi:hypothetical protein
MHKNLKLFYFNAFSGRGLPFSKKPDARKGSR